MNLLHRVASITFEYIRVHSISRMSQISPLFYILPFLCQAAREARTAESQVLEKSADKAGSGRMIRQDMSSSGRLPCRVIQPLNFQDDSVINAAACGLLAD